MTRMNREAIISLFSGEWEAIISVFSGELRNFDPFREGSV